MDALSIGCDPELFLVDNKNKIHSAIGLVGGSKNEPKKVPCGAVQEDNVLAEFNINPAENLDSWLLNIKTVRTGLEDIIRSKGLTTVVKSSHKFTMDELRSCGSKAMEFGCDPDMNIWSGEENNTPNSRTGLRTAGGHIHIGYPKPNIDKSILIGQACEYLLGIPSVLIDKDTTRREMYGKSGAFRFKSYGLEYRVLSNFWLSNEILTTWVYGQAVSCYKLLDKVGEWIEQFPSEIVSQVINESDTDMAEVIVKTLGITMPKGL